MLKEILTEMLAMTFGQMMVEILICVRVLFGKILAEMLGIVFG